MHVTPNLEEQTSILLQNIYSKSVCHTVKTLPLRPGIRGTHLKSSVRMKKMQESSNWLFLGNLILEIESKAPN